MNPQLNETIKTVMSAVESAGYRDATRNNYRKELEIIANELAMISSTHA